MTLESQDNKTTDCCSKCRCGMDEIKHRLCHDEDCECHSPTTDGLVEDAVKEYREKMSAIGIRRDWQIGDEWFRSKLNEVISRTREERDKMAAKYGAERFSEGIREERQFILNILDGVDEADRQMGLPPSTKAIRFALKSRIIESGKSE